MRYLAVILITAMLIATIAFYDTLSSLLWYGGLTIFISVALAAIGFGAYYALIARERILTARLDRKRAQYISYQDGFGMLHLLNLLTDRVENLSTYPGSHHNGTWEDPPPAAAAAWFALVGKARADSPVALLPGAIEEKRPELPELIDMYPHTLIWGGTGGGKTSLLRTVAHRRKLQGHQVLILDRHEHPAKWTGLDRMDTGDKINQAIHLLHKILGQNIEALRTGQALETDFTKITIITDEWTEIVSENEIARQFIATMVRQSRKYGLHLVFATQTNLAIDLGLDGRYKIINGFLQLELVKRGDGYYANATAGGQKLGEYAAPAPPEVPQLPPTGYVAPSLETVLPDEPTEQEQLILDMMGHGESYRAISKAAWGGKVGTWYNQKIDEIAKKWGVRV